MLLSPIKSFKYRSVAQRCSLFCASANEIITKISTENESALSATDYIPYLKESDKEVNSQSLFGIHPIGIVRSPYINRFNTPKQATIESCGGKQEGYIEVFPEYIDCIDQLGNFDYIWAITFMHLNSGFKKKIKPMPNSDLLQSPKSAVTGTSPPPTVGLFCSRAPHRPNPVALSALRVVRVDAAKGHIHVDGLDLLNGTWLFVHGRSPLRTSRSLSAVYYVLFAVRCVAGTPVVDIKPYVPAFDCFPEARAGETTPVDSAIDVLLLMVM